MCTKVRSQHFDTMSKLSRGSEAKQVSLQLLELDSNNPRFLKHEEGVSQVDLVNRLNNTYDLLSVGKLITENGYSNSEPITVFQGDPTEPLIVVEGNRRTAALVILTNKKIRKSLSKYSKEWETLAKTFYSKYEKNVMVPVVICKTRREANAIISHNHISGKLNWEPPQQARYIANLVNMESYTFNEVSKLTGIGVSEVKEKYASIMLIPELELLGIETDKVYDRMTILQNCMRNKEIRTKLYVIPTAKIETGKSMFESSMDVSELKFIVEIIFGTTKNKPILTDSREIIKFAQAVASPIGYKELKSGKSLDETIKIINETGASPSKIVNNIMTSMNSQIDVLLTNSAYVTPEEYAELKNKITLLVKKIKKV